MRIPLIIPRNREGFKNWLKYVGVMFIILSVFFSVKNIDFKTPEFIAEGKTAIAEMNSTDVYQLSDILVFDEYAYYDDNKTHRKVFLIAVPDSDGEMKFASLVTEKNENSEISNKLDHYLSDNDQQVGDCMFSGCFTAASFEEFDRDTKSRNNLKQFCNEMIVGFRQDFNLKQTDRVFKFACSTQEEFAEYKQGIQNENIKWIIISVAQLLGGIAFLAIGIAMTKKDKKDAIEHLNGGIYYNPNQMPNYENDEKPDDTYIQNGTVNDYCPPERSAQKQCESAFQAAESEPAPMPEEPVRYEYETAQPYSSPEPVIKSSYNTSVKNIESTPQKSKVPRIIGRILSVILFIISALVTIVFVSIIADGNPEYISDENVTIKSIDYVSVYELKDLKIIDHYYSDSLDEYYLASYQDKDGAEKIISLVCYNDDKTFPLFSGSSNGENADAANKIISVAATYHFLSDDAQNGYNKSFEEYNKQNPDAVLAGLSLRFVCNPTEADFEAYCKSERNSNIGIAVGSAVIMLIGIILIYFSFRKRLPENKTPIKPYVAGDYYSQNGSYYNPYSSNENQSYCGNITNDKNSF